MSKIIEFLSGKKMFWPILLGILGVVFLLIGGEWTQTNETQSQTSSEEYLSVRFYTKELEDRIEALCREIHGIGEVHVLLTLEGGSEYVYAENVSASFTDRYMSKNSDTPLVVQEIYPKIRGIAVVCSHGEDSAVQLMITELLGAAFGIPSSRIYVAGT